jgi:hypothetical protein
MGLQLRRESSDARIERKLYHAEYLLGSKGIQFKRTMLEDF